MSADNWAICPRCNKTYEQKKAELHKAYGTVTAEEYSRLLKQVEAERGDKYTLREDYELGILKGQFYVNYSVFCEACGFAFNYKDKVEVHA